MDIEYLQKIERKSMNYTLDRNKSLILDRNERIISWERKHFIDVLNNIKLHEFGAYSNFEELYIYPFDHPAYIGLYSKIKSPYCMSLAYT